MLSPVRLTHRHLAASLLALPLIASCVSDDKYDEMARTEAAIEDERKDLESRKATGSLTEDELRRLAKLIVAEEKLESLLERAGTFTAEGWKRTAFDGVGKGLTGDTDGLLTLLGILGANALGLFVVKKGNDKKILESGKALAAERDTTRNKALTGLMRVRDEAHLRNEVTALRAELTAIRQTATPVTAVPPSAPNGAATAPRAVGRHPYLASVPETRFSASLVDLGDDIPEPPTGLG